MRTVSHSTRFLAALVPLLGSLLLAVGPTATAQTAIVGGGDADQRYPFIVSLQKDGGEHYCGGALVAPTWVATAAHCVSGYDLDTLTARVGSSDRTTGGEVRTLADARAHPDYDPHGAGGDLALVRLADPVESAPVDLATSAKPGTKTRLLGWGQTCPDQGCGDAPKTLQQLDTTITAPKGCTTDFASDVELCTNNPGGDTGACYGDSGGPQLVRSGERWRLVGVSSRPGNDDSTCATAPSIYTSTVAYAGWVQKQLDGSSTGSSRSATTTNPSATAPAHPTY